MTPDQLRLEDAERWLAIARGDLRAAEILIGAGSYSQALFYCQQAAEKALKGLLTRHGRPFSKTHDISDFAADCLEIDPSLDAALFEPNNSRSTLGVFGIQARLSTQAPPMPPMDLIPQGLWLNESRLS